MQRVKYCTGLACQDWGRVPEAFDERIHVLVCPVHASLMSPVSGHPHEAGYRSAQQVTPLVERNDDSTS